jgi:hemerythrin-like domain-containing protein
VKRSPALAPLSRDHHQALSAALRLRRATDADLDDAVGAFARFWDEHGRRHFAIEEELLVPALADDADWRSGTERMVGEHEEIRRGVAALTAGTPGRLAVAHGVGALLDRHVRFEERELFVLLEERLPGPALDRLGAAIEAAEAGG